MVFVVKVLQFALVLQAGSSSSEAVQEGLLLHREQKKEGNVASEQQCYEILV